MRTTRKYKQASLLLTGVIVFGTIANATTHVAMKPNVSKPHVSKPHVLPVVEQTQPAPIPIAWPAQVNHFAGDGVPGLINDNTGNSRFSDPYGIAVAQNGTVYVADGGDNNCIRKIAANGIVSTLAGAREGFADGDGLNAKFNTPSGLVIDKEGNLIVADTGNNAIRKVTPQGLVTTLAGNGTAGFRDGLANSAQFNGPLGLALDGLGNIYVADTYNDSIRVITREGQVKTIAGGDRSGYQDGPARSALFDTPSSVVVDATGTLLIADTRNNAIRKLSTEGLVTTLFRTLPTEHKAWLRRPLSLALAQNGNMYIGEMGHGRILELDPLGVLRGISGIGLEIPVGDDNKIRFSHPAGMTIASNGDVLVSDTNMYSISRVSALSSTNNGLAVRASAAQSEMPVATKLMKKPQFPWPLAPQNAWHEIVGTMGEVRGNYDGESRDHFHSGIDVQAEMNTPVLAIANGKISSPLSTWAYGDLNEGLSVGAMAYIHMRVGRDASNRSLDPSRFVVMQDEKGKPSAIRVKRGTRFYTGDTLGFVNRMFHVHLQYSLNGTVANPLSLQFNDYQDHIAPHIQSITLLDAQEKRLSQKRNGRLLVPAEASELHIQVDAYDQLDGNLARRRLGLYELGYQILHADGSVVAGFETPRMTIEFNRLPFDDETVKVAYAARSGDTAHDHKTTRFIYDVTNTVRNGMAQTGVWRASDLSQGNYTLRIIARDYAGNTAVSGRDLPITILSRTSPH